MFGRWHKTRADRQMWRSATTVAGLGELMASWLEGAMIWRPGAAPGLDPETAGLEDLLARANRAGYLTTDSQPGFDGPGFDGLRWRQHAAVTGLIADEQLLARIRRVGEAAGLTVMLHSPRLGLWSHAVPVTFRGGEPHTSFGAQLTARDLRHIWRGINRQALAEISAAWQVTVIDPEFGRDDRLWSALDEAIRTHVPTI